MITVTATCTHSLDGLAHAQYTVTSDVQVDNAWRDVICYVSHNPLASKHYRYTISTVSGNLGGRGSNLAKLITRYMANNDLDVVNGERQAVQVVRPTAADKFTRAGWALVAYAHPACRNCVEQARQAITIARATGSVAAGCSCYNPIGTPCSATIEKADLAPGVEVATADGWQGTIERHDFDLALYGIAWTVKAGQELDAPHRTWESARDARRWASWVSQAQ